MEQTTISDYEIVKFLEIFKLGKNNIRFRILHRNGQELPHDKYMQLNINQIDDQAKERLFVEFKKRFGIR